MNCPNAADVFVPDAQNTRLLRTAFGKFATGVTVVTAHSDKGPIGITANSFSSVSLRPPMVLWCADMASKRYPVFAVARHFAVHVLSEDQSELCWQVAGEGCLHALNPDTNAEGVPIIPDCLARFECAQTANYDGGDHAIILGRVLRAHIALSGKPLTFYGGQVSQIAP